MCNKKVLNFGIIPILLMFFSGIAFADTYTVCRSGCHSSSIQGLFDAKDIEPDDVIEVRADIVGGTTRYYETVRPGSDDKGSAGHPVILKAREGDTIIVDGQDTRDYGFYLPSIDYFVVDGFNIDNTNAHSIRISGLNANYKIKGVTVKNCIINIAKNAATSMTHDGIYVLYADDIYLAKNSVTTDDGSLPYQTDCIYIQASSNVDVDNNFLINRNDDSKGHIDGVQVAGGNGSIPYGSTSNITIRNNTIIHNNSATNYKQLIYVEYEVQGYIKIYNNVLYSTNPMGSNALSVYNNNPSGTHGETHIYNNTIYVNGNGNGIVTDNGVHNPNIKNNIVYIKSTDASALIYMKSSIGDPSRINGNKCYKPGGNDNYRFVNTFYTYSEWKSAGFDAGGRWADPQFANIATYPYNLKVKSSGSTIDDGITLTAEYGVDKNGKVRPSGAAWDSGAYEEANTENPKNLRVVN